MKICFRYIFFLLCFTLTRTKELNHETRKRQKTSRSANQGLLLSFQLFHGIQFYNLYMIKDQADCFDLQVTARMSSLYEPVFGIRPVQVGMCVQQDLNQSSN